MQEISSYLTTIASIIAALTAIVGFISVTSKRGKTAISKWFSKLNEPLNKATLCTLRKDVKEMCRDCMNKGFMDEEDCEDITAAYEAYAALNGNSYIHKLVEKVMVLPVKCGSDN